MSRDQDKDKKKMLAKLARMPIIEAACKQAGIPRATYYRWRKDDPDFAAACDEAIEHSSDLVNDMAESQLISAIKDKSMPAITFWLKHHHAAYRTRVEVDARVSTIQEGLTPEQESVVREALRLAGLTDQRELHEQPE